MNSKGVITVLKNLFPLWNNGKKKVKPVVYDERLLPFCLLCRQTLTNESMKSGLPENHLIA